MSAGAREEILSRIARALADGKGEAQGAPAVIDRAYRSASGLAASERLARLADRVRAYRASVEETDLAGLPAAVALCLRRAGGGSYVLPKGVDAALCPPVPGVAYVPDEKLSPRELAACAGAVSGCAVAIAETGTIVLDGGVDQGRRAITLVPDHLVCVVREHQVVGTVPEAIRALEETMRRGAAALTFVSGPSATSDIELRRVEGVHGPRRLDVVLVRGA